MIILGRGLLSIKVGVAGHRKDLRLCKKVRSKEEEALFDLDSLLYYSNLPPTLPLLSSPFPLVVIKHSSLIFAVAIYYSARS